jgi:hypothetical protein
VPSGPFAVLIVSPAFADELEEDAGLAGAGLVLLLELLPHAATTSADAATANAAPAGRKTAGFSFVMV